ncbi:recombinase family protein [Skermanella sp. TT6]|uniref:recombinase family protein n=1 Tax=Skermanella cutis TaxID=2775420 RepID=UPI001FFEE959|nr:recombinase family protein [Skermanella sp. TT6]
MAHRLLPGQHRQAGPLRSGAGGSARSGPVLSQRRELDPGRRGDRGRERQAQRLDRALGLCRLYGATLVVAKLDRLARNVAFISKLMESNIDLVAADFPQANRLTIHILAIAMITQRTIPQG